MATNYPASTDDATSLPLVIDNVTSLSSSIINNLRNAIVAIEQELGAVPSSTFTTVRSRLDSLETTINSTLAITSINISPGGTPVTGDVIFQAGSNIALTQIGNTIRITSTGGGGGGGGVANLGEAVLAQDVTPVTQTTNLNYQIDNTFAWKFRNNTPVDLFNVTSNTNLSLASVNVGAVNSFTSNAVSNNLVNGGSFGAGSYPISVGETDGQINADLLQINSIISSLTLQSADNLNLDSSNLMIFSDAGKTASTFTDSFKLSKNSTDWETYKSYFGETGSLLTTINSYNKLFIYSKPHYDSETLFQLLLGAVSCFVLDDITKLPSEVIAINSTTIGAIAATVDTIGVASTNLISNPNNLLKPLNLVEIRDISTSGPIVATTAGREIFGLLQTNGANGGAFTISNCQITLVTIQDNGDATIIGANDISMINNKSINYSFTYRSRYLSLNSDINKNDHFSYITSLESAINSQAGNTVKEYKSVTIEFQSKGDWKFTSADTNTIFNVHSASNGLVSSADVSIGNVASFISGAVYNEMTNYLTVDTANSTINIGATTNTIDSSILNLSSTTSQLTLSSAAELALSSLSTGQILLRQNDIETSTYTGVTFNSLKYMPLAVTGTTDWNTFTTNFGASTSLLAAINTAYSTAASLSGVRSSRFQGALTSTSSANTTFTSGSFSTSEGTFPSLGANSTEFQNKVNVYLNGLLMRNGASYDVLWISSSSFQFNQAVNAGDVVIIEKFS